MKAGAVIEHYVETGEHDIRDVEAFLRKEADHLAAMAEKGVETVTLESRTFSSRVVFRHLAPADAVAEKVPGAGGPGTAGSSAMGGSPEVMPGA